MLWGMILGRLGSLVLIVVGIVRSLYLCPRRRDPSSILMASGLRTLSEYIRSNSTVSQSTVRQVIRCLDAYQALAEGTRIGWKGRVVWGGRAVR